MTAEDGWRLLAAALAARRAAPPLVPEKPWGGVPASLAAAEPLPVVIRLAAAVVDDRPLDAIHWLGARLESLSWTAVALRRAARFREARRAFRERGPHASDASLYEQALSVLSGAGSGFRWAGEAVSHLTARGTWDSVWFVDACAGVYSGLLSRETGALLEEIQRAELLLLVAAGAASQS